MRSGEFSFIDSGFKTGTAAEILAPSPFHLFDARGPLVLWRLLLQQAAAVAGDLFVFFGRNDFYFFCGDADTFKTASDSGTNTSTVFSDTAGKDEKLNSTQ